MAPHSSKKDPTILKHYVHELNINVIYFKEQYEKGKEFEIGYDYVEKVYDNIYEIFNILPEGEKKSL